MNGAQVLLARLRAHAIDTLFGYPGGAILPFYDALRDQPGLRHVLVRHEQAAAFAAEGYARATGRLGVAVATSGPGATNLVTGIADAAMDSIPLLVLTGQVSTSLLGTSAFQEVDMIGMTLGICKHSAMVRDPAELADAVDEAIHIATHGRPGPVLLDLPKDVLMHPAPSTLHRRRTAAPPPRDLPLADLERAAALLRSARRPLLLSGGGLAHTGRIELLRRLAEQEVWPHVTTLRGIGNAPPRHPGSLGMIGMYGNPAANEVLAECDVLLALGVRFDERATGDPNAFAPQARVVHIDIDRGELQRVRTAEVAMAGDLAELLPALATALAAPHLPPPAPERAAWWSECVARKRAAAWDHPTSHGPRWLAALGDALPPHAFVTCDVGNHQMWVARYMPFADPRRHLSSGGFGAMGFGLPAAIGAQLACPDATVVVVSGDGSFMMNVQELETVRREQLPIKMVVIDNAALAMVGQQQRVFYGGESHCNLSNPDFVTLARAFGIPAQCVRPERDPAETWATWLREPGPGLLVLPLLPRDEVWPLVPPGRPNHPMRHGGAP